MESALQKAGIRNVLGPDGSLNGPEETLEPVTVGGRQWLQGSLCEQGNCGDHYLRFLYSPGTHQVLGFYVDGQARWVGKPPAEEAKLLRGNADAIAEKTPLPSALPAAPAAPADGAPADTIWTFKGDGGKSLWQVCGGQNSSCTIIANTKYYVAVLNRKSATGCAFGDFYVAARDTASWQQYDTGTCSPDAYIRKGSINNGQYLSVDIGINGVLVKQFPIGYWSMRKEFSGSRRPSWSKVKEKISSTENTSDKTSHQAMFLREHGLSVLYHSSGVFPCQILAIHCCPMVRLPAGRLKLSWRRTRTSPSKTTSPPIFGWSFVTAKDSYSGGSGILNPTPDSGLTAICSATAFPKDKSPRAPPSYQPQPHRPCTHRSMAFLFMPQNQPTKEIKGIRI